MRKVLCTIVVAASIGGLPAAAHDHATGVIKERMELMENMDKRLKAIRARIAHKRDLAAIKADAATIAAGSAHVVRLFPLGSTQHPTDAKAAIWQSWPDFESKAQALEVESKKLVETSPADVAGLAAQLRAVTQTCGGCHEKYREKQK